MRTRPGPLAALLVGALALVSIGLVPLAAPRGSAQEATPAAAAEVALPITPDPSLCAAAPVAREPYAAVVGTPGPGTPAAPPPLGPPTGEPAAAATVAAVTAVLVEVFACANADDMARLVGFYTPEFWAWGMHPDVFALMAATPTALPEEQWATLVAVREVRVEADGRVAALVEAEQGGTLMVRAFRFVERGGRWLIAEEEIVETRPAEQPAGSPTAEV